VVDSGSRRRYRNETKSPLNLVSHSVRIGKSNSRNQRHDDVEDVEHMYCRSTLNSTLTLWHGRSDSARIGHTEDSGCGAESATFSLVSPAIDSYDDGLV